MEHDENDDDDDDDDVVVVGVVKESVCVFVRERQQVGRKKFKFQKKTMIQLTLNTERDKKGKSLSFFLSLT